MTDCIDSSTGRPFGDHGSADDVIQFVFEHFGNENSEAVAFISYWTAGDLRRWPQYYRWLECREFANRSVTHGEKLRIAEVLAFHHFREGAFHASDERAAKAARNYAASKFMGRVDEALAALAIQVIPEDIPITSPVQAEIRQKPALVKGWHQEFGFSLGCRLLGRWKRAMQKEQSQ